MNWLMIKNDFKRNKAINSTLLLFMTFAYCLAAASLVVVVQLLGSISGLYETAQPPHFLQMHKGEINQKSIDKFNSRYKGINYWQTVTMIDVYGNNLKVQNKHKSLSLSDCLLDIGLVKQNHKRDLLLNKDKEKVTLKPGEIGIPVLLRDAYDIKTGDQIILNANGITKKFYVKEFVLDAQMNSSMCSSTRVLISDKDFNSLSGIIGEKEYLIEAYFKDSGMAPSYQTAYENAGLPQSGQAVTYKMIYLLSALTDIAMAFLLLFASVLLVLIAAMCIRFTALSAMEENLSEIGAMKAIGMSFKSIRSIYLAKYRMLAAVAGVIGYVLALITSNIFTSHISTTFGRKTISVFNAFFPILACALIFFFIDYCCKKILKKMKKVTVVDALVTGDGFMKKKNKVRDGLYKAKRGSVNMVISLREVFFGFRNWALMFIVMLMASLIILIPMNMLHTIQSSGFVSYMGSNLKDILLQLENGNGLENRHINAERVLGADRNISSYDETFRVRVATYDAEKEQKNIYIDCSDTAGKGLQYLNGNAPTKDNEIAISYLNSQETGKKVGDAIALKWDGINHGFIVTGIYQDVTSGGYTAKARYTFPKTKRELYSFSLSLKDNVDASKEADKLSKMLGDGFTVQPVDDFIDQTLGGVTNQLSVIVVIVMVTGLFLAGLISVLFMKLRIAKDYSQIAAMKAIGFSVKDVRQQYLMKAGIVSLLGIIAGTLLANTAGETVVDMVLMVSGLGISRIHFIINGLVAYAICPLGLILAVITMTWLCARPIRGYNIISLINE